MKIQIAFEITATCHQEIVIYEYGITENDILKGLKNGTYITSTWINEDNETILEDKNGKVIGKIISQEIDGEYENYR